MLLAYACKYTRSTTQWIVLVVLSLSIATLHLCMNMCICWISLMWPLCFPNLIIWQQSYLLHNYLVARVGFEETFYQVNETTGTVEICVVVYEPDIDCPIQMEFTVSFETGAETAGTCMYIHILASVLMVLLVIVLEHFMCIYLHSYWHTHTFIFFQTLLSQGIVAAIITPQDLQIYATSYFTMLFTRRGWTW